MTVEEYLERYAKDYCNGDTEEAKKHAIVREVMKEKEGEHKARILSIARVSNETRKNKLLHRLVGRLQRLHRRDIRGVESDDIS